MTSTEKRERGEGGKGREEERDSSITLNKREKEWGHNEAGGSPSLANIEVFG